MADWNENFDAIVVGSGFGSAVAITKLVTDGLPNKPNPRVLVIERGTWWRNPEGPGLRKHKTKSPPPILGDWQYWARPNDSLGFTYVANSIYKEHNPVWDAVNPFFRDNDLGPKKNIKGLYRFTRFSHDNGKVDVVSGSAVGGGSLFYSGVNLIPHQPVLKRIGLAHLTSQDFRKAGEWMASFRGKINKINTKMPVPHYVPKPADVDPRKHLQLGRIPESADDPSNVGFEMPNPDLDGAPDADYMLLDRARVLKRAMERVVAGGGFSDGASHGEVWKDEFRHAFEPIPLSVIEYDKDPGSNSTDKNTFCQREGRCVLGCLPSARHTLYKTIQARQEKGGDITVLPLTKVSHLSRGDNDDYVVHFESHLDGPEGKLKRAVAPKVFVGAGCLGTSEVLLRTQEKFDQSGGADGLPLSQLVGKHFSTNGDFFGFAYDLARDRDTRKTVGDDVRIGNANPTVGPINSSHFYVIFDGDTPNRIDVNVEDAGVPTTFARLLHGVLPHFNEFERFMNLAKALVRVLLGREPFTAKEPPDPENRDQAAYLTERELLQNVFFYNLMGSGPDEPLGAFTLQKDGVGLDLEYDKPLGDWVVFKRQEAVLEALTEKMGENGKKPQLLRSPFWTREKRVTVVHPLGGCPIGADSSHGAADSLGRLYDGSKPPGGADVHKGLYVVDAAAIPGALGVNPTFTIVTQAVRTVENALAEA